MYFGGDAGRSTRARAKDPATEMLHVHGTLPE
jgi:hypothetical protein